MTLSRPAALIAGLGLLAMAALAIWANFAVFDSLIVRSDPAGSVARLIDSGATFPLAIAAFWAVAALDVVVALALWALLRPRAPGWAAAGGVLRLVYTAVLVAALVPLTRAPGLLDPAAPDAAMTAIGSFYRIWLAGLAIFGASLIAVAIAAFRAGLPRLVALATLIAGLAYVYDTTTAFFAPDLRTSYAIAAFMGELVLMGWLLWHGLRRG